MREEQRPVTVWQRSRICDGADLCSCTNVGWSFLVPLVHKAGSDNSLQSFQPYFEASWDYLADSSSVLHVKLIYLLGERSLSRLSTREGLTVVQGGSELGAFPCWKRCLSVFVFPRGLVLVQMSQEMGSPFFQREIKSRRCLVPTQLPNHPHPQLPPAREISNNRPVSCHFAIQDSTGNS